MKYPILFQKIRGEKPSLIDPGKSGEWNIVCKEFPFKLYGNAKELYSNSWPGENGLQEYVPDSLTFEAYEMDVEFVYKGEHGTANTNIKAFLDYLTGNDGKNEGVLVKVYDTYTGIGRVVRFAEVKEDLFFRKEGEEEVVTFSVRFKVNNPMEEVTPVYNPFCSQEINTILGLEVYTRQL